MHREPAGKRHLLALDLLERLALLWPCYRFAIRLTPPAARRLVLEHRVEVIHAHEAELLRFAVDRWLEDATSAADGAEADHDRLPIYGVANLMVVADELDGIRSGLAIDFDPDDESRGIDHVLLGRLHVDRRWRHEDLVGGHHVVRRVSHQYHDGQGQRGERSSPAFDAKGRDQATEHDCPEQP